MAGPVRPVAIVLDELKYHISRPALEALGTARDKGVHLVLAHQSLGDLRDCPKDLDPDAVVDAVVENCRIKLAYRVISPDTAEWLARMSGSILVDDEMRKVEKNMALVETMSGERSIRQAERYLIDENMLLNLPKSVAVTFGYGLPKFVSVMPIMTTKRRAAIAIEEVKGDMAADAAAIIDVGDFDAGDTGDARALELEAVDLNDPRLNNFSRYLSQRLGEPTPRSGLDGADGGQGEGDIFDRLDSLANPKPASPKAKDADWDDSPI